MMIFTSLYGVIDGIFVTNFAGKSALAAVNFAFPILNILATFGYMFGVGGSALVAKTLGEGNKEKANQLFSMFVYICTIVGIAFAVIGYFLLEALMIKLGAEGKMLEEAVVYGKILLFTLPFWNLQFLFQIFFVTAEKHKYGLYISLIAGISNIVLDALLIGVFNLGIAGAAIATGIGQVIGGGIPLLYFLSKNSSLLRLGKMTFDSKSFFKGTTNGLSELVSGVSSSLVGILYNTQLYKYAGEDGVAAYGIMMYVAFIFVGIFIGYANGVSPVISYNYGAENKIELKNLYKKSLTLMLGSSLAMFIISIILSKPLSLVFASYDQNLYQMTLHGFRIYSLSFLFSGIAIFSSAFFTALNNGLVSAILSFLRTIVFQVLFVLWFPILFSGIDGIWFSVVIAEMLSFIVAIIFIRIYKNEYQY